MLSQIYFPPYKKIDSNLHLFILSPYCPFSLYFLLISTYWIFVLLWELTDKGHTQSESQTQHLFTNHCEPRFSKTLLDSYSPNSHLRGVGLTWRRIWAEWYLASWTGPSSRWQQWSSHKSACLQRPQAFYTFSNMWLMLYTLKLNNFNFKKSTL